MGSNDQLTQPEKIPFVYYSLFGAKVSDIDLSTPKVINTLNPHSFCVAEKDTSFKEALQKSDILLPDGIGVVLANNFFNKRKIHKISGMDLFDHLMFLTRSTDNIEFKKVFFLGSKTSTLERIQKKLSIESPSVVAEYYSPPFKNEFTEEDNSKMLEAISTFRPHILFVGMTAPKQEKWVYLNRERIHAKIICNIGAVFDFYAGTIKRPRLFWIGLGLEWFARLIKETGRLWRRNFISSPQFVLKVTTYNIKRLFA